MNTYSVYHLGTEYDCHTFYDVDRSISGITIKDQFTGKIIGEIFGLSIPDIDDLDGDAEETIKFEKIITDFIDENL